MDTGFHRREPRLRLALAVLLAGCLCTTTLAGAAANHLLNSCRTGYTSRPLPPPYRLVWTHRARHKPRHAWREPAWEVQRIDFDYAYALSAGNGLVYYASSSEHAVCALDLATGAPRWRFFTCGPVRLAPTVHEGRIFFSSDDGWAYCLNGNTGALVWKYRPTIPGERLIGNEQIISRWPARSGVLVSGGRAYTTFGMWSPEGIVVSCLNADTGALIWQNDSSGTNYQTHPHYEAMGGVSPQGYLALDGHVLAVPCGRAAPAFFDARTGEFLYHESEGLFPGGAWTMLHGGLTFVACEYLQKPNPVRPTGPEADISDEASLVALRTDTREEVFHLNGALRGVVTDAGVLNLIGPKKLISVALSDVLRAAPDSYKAKMGSSEGHMVPAAKIQRWETPVERVFDLIQAGSTLIAGGRGAFTCYDAAKGHKTWEAKVPGDVHELLVAGDALLVGTTEGEIHCFRPGQQGEPRVTRPRVRETAVPAQTTTRVERLLAAAGVADGYALWLGHADAPLLAELARQSRLVWHWPTGSPNAKELSAQLADAGLYGTRIAIHDVPDGDLPYTDYMANLIVLTAKSEADLSKTPAAEIRRVLRPYGGVAVIACPDALRPAVEQWLRAGAIAASETRPVPVGVRIQRGPLPGAGSWTHQYADPGKSGASRDQRVRLPLKVLWFGGYGPADAVSRHYRGPAPLAINGRLFVPGNEFLHAVDAYSGRILWERKLPGIGRWPMPYRSGSIAADEGSVYALQGTTCLRLDSDTGKTLFTYHPPEGWDKSMKEVPSLARRKGRRGITVSNEPIWEFLAVTGDAVIGSVGLPNVRPTWWSHAHPANGLLFVLDKTTGQAKWTYQSASAVGSNAIAIEEDRLFLIDGLAPVDIFTRPRRGSKAKSRPVYRVQGAAHQRVLEALDLQSGKELWRSTEIGARQNSLYAASGVVLSTVPVWHGLRSTKEGPELSAFSSRDGKLLWTRQRRGAHPVVIGDTVYVPDACDLHTGKPILRQDPLTGAMVPFAAPVTGGCGRLAGCPGVMMKRSGSMGFADLKQRSGMYHYPNMRASCWINMVPACGLVLVPEGSSSCPCAYNYKTSIAFMSASRHNHWGLFGPIRRGKAAVIKHLRLNLGAPGDKPDSAGNIWHAFPRPSTTGPRGGGGMGRVAKDKPPIELIGEDKAVRTASRNPDWTQIVGTDKPWLYTYAVAGLLRLRIRLGPEGTPACPYRVALHFCELDGSPSGGPLSVMVQGRTVLSDLAVREQAGGANHALVKPFTVDAGPQLTLEVLPTAGACPSLCAIEVARQ